MREPHGSSRLYPGLRLVPRARWLGLEALGSSPGAAVGDALGRASVGDWKVAGDWRWQQAWGGSGAG